MYYEYDVTLSKDKMNLRIEYDKFPDNSATIPFTGPMVGLVSNIALDEHVASMASCVLCCAMDALARGGQQIPMPLSGDTDADLDDNYAGVSVHVLSLDDFLRLHLFNKLNSLSVDELYEACHAAHLSTDQLKEKAESLLPFMATVSRMLVLRDVLKIVGLNEADLYDQYTADLRKS